MNIGNSKIITIFAVFLLGTKILTLVCVVFFIATNLAAKAANLGYHSNGCCTARSVIVLDRTEKGSLFQHNPHSKNSTNIDRFRSTAFKRRH